jgi:hypothetical protein
MELVYDWGGTESCRGKLRCRKGLLKVTMPLPHPTKNYASVVYLENIDKFLVNSYAPHICMKGTAFAVKYEIKLVLLRLHGL